jgi:alkylation response protein AidB-like acyl-CoA dehydrogenase
VNFDLSDEQALFQASVERFAAPLDGEARRRLRGADGGYSRDRWLELAGLGLIALAAGEAQGGIGGNPIDLVVVAEAIGRTIAPDPWLENGVLPAVLLAAAGRDDLLAGVLSGESFAAFAFAERAQRYNLHPKATVARRRGGDITIDGHKTLVLGGVLADCLIVSANCDGNARLFAVPASREGVLRRPYRLVDGSIAGEVRFAAVSVSPDEELAIGSAELEGCIALVRLLAAAEMLGLAQRLFDDTLAYVKQREQFGVAIGSFQAIQHRLVECYAALEQSRSMVYRAALADRRDPSAWNRAAAGAKAYLSAQADLIAREAVQMHGGMGITDELAIGHAMKRVLLLATLFGDRTATLSDYAKAA